MALTKVSRGLLSTGIVDNSTTTAITIDSSENVGIGQAPSAFSNWKILELKGGTAGAMLNFENSSSTRVSSLAYDDGSDSLRIQNFLANPITFETSNTERMRISANGNVSIGLTTDTHRLHVVDAANRGEANAQFAILGSGYTGYHFLDGTAYYIGQNSAGRALRLYSGAETTGVNLANGGTSFGTFSDERLKENIEPIEGAIESLSQFRTVKYHLKDVDTSESKKRLGLIAQDLVGVLDEVIDPLKRQDDDTEYMAVRYTEIIPVLVKAIQEQQATIQELEARITQLENN